MIGSNSANLIADAYINGVRGFDAETLYDAMIKNATTSEGRPKDKKGRVVGAVGREGVEYYNPLGYVPYDVGINENRSEERRVRKECVRVDLAGRRNIKKTNHSDN